jgi:hypothetical protein
LREINFSFHHRSLKKTDLISIDSFFKKKKEVKEEIEEIKRLQEYLYVAYRDY